MKIKYFILALSFLTGFTAASCNQKKYSAEYYKSLVNSAFPYNMGAPSEKYEFPKELREISDLEYYKDGIIACVQDEAGILYLYNTQSKKLDRKIKFIKHGDFECVALAGDYAFMMKSDGHLFGHQIDAEDKVKPDLFKTPFSSKNNLEGLCFNPTDSSLLIACKDDAGLEIKLKGRAVYRYDLRTKTIDPDPFIHITNKEYKQKLDSFNLEIKYHSPFKPSGISINPINGNIYLISSIGKLMIVFDHDKNIINMVPLDRETLRQPEGICFSPNGDLYISSEGGNDKGYMLLFRMVH